MKQLWITVAALPLLLLASCGSDYTTVGLTGNDLMQFNTRQFTVPAGGKVKLTMTNVGKMPKTAMGHNVVVLKLGIKVNDWAPQLAAKGATIENDHLPESVRGDVIAHTRVLGPGESQTIDFVAPQEKGIYNFVCTFPGHFATMNGVMMVE